MIDVREEIAEIYLFALRIVLQSYFPIIDYRFSLHFRQASFFSLETGHQVLTCSHCPEKFKDGFSYFFVFYTSEKLQ